MNKIRADISNSELREIVEMMAIFQKLPRLDQIAIKYYLKGRIDTMTGNTEIPINKAIQEASA